MHPIYSIHSQVEQARRTLTMEAGYRMFDTSLDRVDHLKVFDYKRLDALSRGPSTCSAESSSQQVVMEMVTLPYNLDLDVEFPLQAEGRILDMANPLDQLDHMVECGLISDGTGSAVVGEDSDDEDESDGEDAERDDGEGEEDADEEDEEEDEDQLLKVDQPEEVMLEDEESGDVELDGEWGGEDAEE